MFVGGRLAGPQAPPYPASIRRSKSSRRILTRRPTWIAGSVPASIQFFSTRLARAWTHRRERLARLGARFQDGCPSRMGVPSAVVLDVDLVVHSARHSYPANVAVPAHVGRRYASMAVRRRARVGFRVERGFRPRAGVLAGQGLTRRTQPQHRPWGTSRGRD